MKKIRVILICILVLLALIVLTFEIDSVQADTSADVYFTSITAQGKLTTTKVGSVTYTLVQNSLYRFDSTSTTGIQYYLNTHSCSTFDFINTQSQVMEKSTSGGSYITTSAYGTLSHIVIYNPYYTITYNLDGGIQNPQNKEAFYATDSEFQLYEPTKEGFVFGGFYKESTFQTNITSIKPQEITDDVTLYARWYEKQYLDVYTRLHDGFNIHNNKVADCYYVYLASKNMYRYDTAVFSYLDTYAKQNLDIIASSGDPLTVLTSAGFPITLASSGSPSFILLYDDYYEITYNLNGGSFEENSIKYYSTKDDLNNIKSPTKDGYRFIGWYLDENLTSPLFPISSSFECSNLTLYASFTEEFSIDVKHQYTDGITENIETVDSVSVYLAPNLNYYVYSSNLLNKANLFDSPIHVYDQNNNEIEIRTQNGKFISLIHQNKPHSILIKKEYYSIQYMCDANQLDTNSINYYSTKQELIDNLKAPHKDNFVFISWYLNEELNETITSSSFTVSNITLYPKWSEKKNIDVYYYDDTKTPHEHSLVGSTYYYTLHDNFYYYGNLADTQNQLGYYLNKYNSTSFYIVDENNNKLTCTTSNGQMLSYIDENTPTAVYIYRCYYTNFYINGIKFYSHTGVVGATIDKPTNIEGFIGKNYEALNVGSLTIGNRYAIYLFEGWSYTDTSDKTWFDKVSVPIIDSWVYEDDQNYIKNVYAYMTFYSKLSENNSNINYDEFIEETDGIILSTSRYTIDELLTEHATKISSDTQLSLKDKISRALGLELTHPLVALLEKFIGNETMSIKEIWDNATGKIFLVIFMTFSLISIISIIISFIKVSKKKTAT